MFKPAGPKTHGSLVDKKMLDTKPEMLIDNLDRSAFIFSKKQLIVANARVHEFYKIQAKYPFADDSSSITLHLTPGDGMASNLVVTPTRVTFNRKTSGVLVKVSVVGERAADLLEDR